jgi:hypothetical protein
MKLELLSNATTIDSALNYIRHKQKQSQQHEDTQKIDTPIATTNHKEGRS